MCLSTVASASVLKREQAKGAILAWKIVLYDYIKYRGRFRPATVFAEAFTVNKDVTLRGKKSLICSERNPYTQYTKGYHAYATREGAEKCCSQHVPGITYPGTMVVPVLLRRIVAVGKQNGQKVYVAREMTILREMPADPRPKPQ